MKTALLSLMAAFALSAPANADTIEINLSERTLSYDSINTSIVAPRKDQVWKYKGKREFNIVRINYKPNWRSPGGRLYKGGSDDNPLGWGRITFLDNSGIVCSIHGTNRPELLGRADDTSCCIRISNEKILDLILKISYDTRVRIKH